MDLTSNNSLRVSYDKEHWKNDKLGDTALCLNFLGYEGNGTTRFGGSQSSLNMDYGNTFPDDGCKLVLGLGPTPSIYNTNGDSFCGAVSSKTEGSLARGLINGSGSILKLGLSGAANDSFSGLVDSSVTEANNNRFSIPVVDEGSTTAKKSGGYMPSLLLAPRMDILKTVPPQAQPVTKSQSNELEPSHEPSATTDFSMSSASEQATTTATSGSSQRSTNPKKCKFPGCSKGGRGASGLCIGHGGGQRCQKQGCNKGAESRTAYCKAHGGGRRCDHLGCTKSAEGKTDFCIAHGGGRRCSNPEGCTKAARGKSGLCIRHGGGKRCKVTDCTRSAEGHAGLCISHGGGRRCQHDNCSKGAQGSTKFCKAHGGGKRCVFSGCTKGAEGSTPLCKAHGGGKRCLFDGGGICPKSVHGGTNFCVAHGGGKRCVIPGCTKSARGRTDCCVRHGGGKRCKFGNCGKSAQGSTDFCKAHGGGKRCSWGGGEVKCEKFARGKSGLCAAHASSLVQERGGMIRSGLFRGLVVSSSSFSGASAVSNSCTDSLEKNTKRQRLIPPQVLVPLSMKSSPSYSSLSSAGKVVGGGSSDGGKSLDHRIVVPEGRVHGGGLMSLFGGNLKNAI